MDNIFPKDYIPEENEIFSHESMTQHDTNVLCHRISSRNMKMRQAESNLNPEMQVIDVRSIDAQPSFTKSLVLCQHLSGLGDKQIVGKQGIVSDVAQWSRVRNGQHFFPQDKLNTFMNLCGNEVPLIWLARSRGYHLVPSETEITRRLRIEREKANALEYENLMLKKLLMSKAK